METLLKSTVDQYAIGAQNLRAVANGTEANLLNNLRPKTWLEWMKKESDYIQFREPRELIKAEMEFKLQLNQYCIFSSICNNYLESSGYKLHLRSAFDKLISIEHRKVALTAEEKAALKQMNHFYKFIRARSNQMSSFNSNDLEKLITVDIYDESNQGDLNMQSDNLEDDLTTVYQMLDMIITPTLTKNIELKNSLSDLYNKYQHLKILSYEKDCAVFKFIVELLSYMRNIYERKIAEIPTPPPILKLNKHDTLVSTLDKALVYLINNSNRFSTYSLCTKIYLKLHCPKEVFLPFNPALENE